MLEVGGRPTFSQRQEGSASTSSTSISGASRSAPSVHRRRAPSGSSLSARTASIGHPSSARIAIAIRWVNSGEPPECHLVFHVRPLSGDAEDVAGGVARRTRRDELGLLLIRVDAECRFRREPAAATSPLWPPPITIASYVFALRADPSEADLERAFRPRTIPLGGRQAPGSPGTTGACRTGVSASTPGEVAGLSSRRIGVITSAESRAVNPRIAYIPRAPTTGKRNAAPM